MLGNKWYHYAVIEAQAAPRMNTKSMFYISRVIGSHHMLLMDISIISPYLSFQILKVSWDPSWLLMGNSCYHYAVIEAQATPRLAPISTWIMCKVFDNMTYCWWACGCIINPIPPHLSAHIWNVSWNSLSLMVYDWYDYAVVDAQALLRFVPTSILIMNKVFDNHHILWKGIRIHHHSITTTLVDS